MDKRWNYIGNDIEGLSIIENILYTKGITKKEDIEEFLRDNPQKTYDPYLIKNMDIAVDKIAEHINNKKRIIIYGDYDVDGVTSTALLMEFLSHVTDSIDYYIPNRFSEGYGMNMDAISFIKNQMKGDLIITVDNGISSLNEVEYAKEIGLDIIVTDHHNPGEKLPDCIVVNVKQPGDEYPFKELCGCGIAFKLAQAIQRRLNMPKEILNNLIDLTALATVADVVPLIDENRTFVKYGLKMINADRRPGLSVLRSIVGLDDKEINAGRIGFIIGPCFNAAGRLEDAKMGVKLLLEKSPEKAEEMANILHTLNRERQKIQKDGEQYCQELVETEYMDYDFLVLRADHISEGVIGIIAGRIKDIFYKPTLIVTKSEEGYLKGSGRSIKGINIFNELSKLSHMFLGFGGHEMACGFSIEEAGLDELRERLNDRAKEIKSESPDVFIPSLDIVGEIKADELTIELIQTISKLEPYGMGNPKPIFIMRKVYADAKYTRPCGNMKNHLKFYGKQKHVVVKGIGFALMDKYRELSDETAFDLACVPEINEYNGIITPQLVIQDIRKG